MIKNFFLLFWALTFVTDIARAEVCSSVLQTLEKKMAVPTKACKDNSPIERLWAKYDKAKTDRLKQTVKKAIETAQKRQKAQCEKSKAAYIEFFKVEDFCRNFDGMDNNYCREGATVAVSGSKVVVRCKRGRIPVYSADKSFCYKVQENYYNTTKDYVSGKAHPAGVLLDFAPLSDDFYYVFSGKLVRGVSAEDCQ